MKHISPDALCRVDNPASTPSAFHEELLKCKPALRRYARKLGGADLADDLEQATLERALKREAVYVEQGAMLAWLRQTMKNIALSRYENERVRRERFPLFCDLAPDASDDNSDQDAEDYDSTVADETTLCEREAQMDAKNLIELAATIIAPERWKCLELTAQGYTSAEIAAELGISDDAVRQNVTRGRNALRVLRASGDDTEHNASKSIRKQSL